MHQQKRKSSRHLPSGLPRAMQERRRKKNVAALSRCFAALGTQKVAKKKENARGVK